MFLWWSFYSEASVPWKELLFSDEASSLKLLFPEGTFSSPVFISEAPVPVRELFFLDSFVSGFPVPHGIFARHLILLVFALITHSNNQAFISMKVSKVVSSSKSLSPTIFPLFDDDKQSKLTYKETKIIHPKLKKENAKI